MLQDFPPSAGTPACSLPWQFLASYFVRSILNTKILTEFIVKDKYCLLPELCSTQLRKVTPNMRFAHPFVSGKRIAAKKALSVTLLLILFSSFGLAANYYTIASGNWNSKTIWSLSPGGASANKVPGGADDIFIQPSHTVLANVNVRCRNLTIASSGVLNVGNKNINITGNTLIGGTLLYSSVQGSVTFTGDITINSGGTWSNSINESITFKGNILNNGTFIGGTGTYTFSGSAKSMGGTNQIALTNLTVNGALTNTGTLSVSGTLAGNNTLTNGPAATLNIGSTASGLTLKTLVATATGNTVNYNGAAQTVKPNAYCNLTLSGSGIKTLQTGTTTLSGNLTLSGSATATAVTGLTIGGNLGLASGTTFTAGAYTHYLAGDLSNSGAFTTTGTLVMNGTSAQTIGGTAVTNFSNLTLNNAGGLTLGNTKNTTVSGTLTLTSGILTTLTNTLILPAGAIVSRTSGYVAGNLQKYITTGTNVNITFETGTSQGYTPVTLSFASVTAAGNLTVVAFQGDHPSIGTSGLNPARSVNRYYTLTNSGIITSAAGYSATFTFLPADPDAGTSTASLSVARYASGAWSLPVTGTRTATTTQASVAGVSAFGDFAIGMLKPTPTTTVLATSASPSCTGSPLTLTATVSSGGVPVVSEGTVTFKDGTTTLGTSTALNAAGQGSITTSALLAGTHSITATFNATTNFAGSSSTAFSQVINSTYLWIGGTSGDWENAANWCGGVPGQSTDVVIPTGTTVNITSAPASPAKCHNLLVSAGAALVINAGKALSVTGLLTNNATAGIVLKSDATGTGSLIDNGLAGSGTAQAECYLKKYNVINDGMYHFLSAPVSGQAIFPNFSNPPGNFTDDFYKLDEPTYTWVSFRNTGNVVNPLFETTLTRGRGYLVAYNADVTKIFTGTLNSGTLTAGSGLPAISYTAAEGSQAGWNLIGNPYPSAIDWDNVSASQSYNLDNAVYVYDNNSQTYKTWVGGFGSLTGGIIPPMQGFLVKAHGASPSLYLENQDRVHSGNLYYKARASVDNALSISVTGNAHADETSLRFAEGATAGFNPQWDAYKLFGGPEAPNLYTTSGNDRMAVKTLPLSAMPGNVPLSLRAASPGTYTLTTDGINTFTQGTEIRLEDRKTGFIQNLNNNPVYTFTVTENDNPDRFVLHFQDITSTGRQAQANNFRVTQHQRMISVATDPGMQAELTLSNILGQPVLHSRTNGSSLTTLDASALAEGIYVLSIRGNNFKASQKIVLSR